MVHDAVVVTDLAVEARNVERIASRSSRDFPCAERGPVDSRMYTRAYSCQVVPTSTSEEACRTYQEWGTLLLDDGVLRRLSKRIGNKSAAQATV